MSDLKLVLYKENRAPRSIALSSRMIYRTLFLAVFLGFLIVVSVGLAARFYLVSRAKSSQILMPISSQNTDDLGPSNSLEDQVRSLRDQLDQANNKLSNAAATLAAPREIDKKNPALALFSPIVVDATPKQNQVVISNFRYAKSNGKSPATLTFDLHNAHPGESVEKGYIVVLARNENALQAYPNVFSRTAPYLLDFEKGETFQVARFRLVNAQFDTDAQNFQILIFTRKGELLINQLHEAKSGS
jgi:hypothetical protein